MAAILIGAGALLTDKLRTRHNAKKAARREYDDNFEQLMAANAARMRHISQSSTDMPPTYDEIIGNASAPKQAAVRQEDEALLQPLQLRRQLNGIATSSSSSDRVDRRDMAVQ